MQRVSREIERDTLRNGEGKLMVGNRDTLRERAQSATAPPVGDSVPVDVDQSSEDSFPASDPPAWAPLHVGAPRTSRVAGPQLIPSTERSGRSA